MPDSQPTNNGLEKIRAVAFDLDGVLTDGSFWWSEDGAELKRFCFADVMGVSVARRAGIQLALISGENSPLVDRYAEKLHIQHVVKGCRDKAIALREFSTAVDIDLAEVCFMGDDINDLPAMRIAGYSAAPANASHHVLSFVNFVATSSGGNGAVREFLEALLDARGQNIQAVFSHDRILNNK